jgi:hypothetical protein
MLGCHVEPVRQVDSDDSVEVFDAGVELYPPSGSLAFVPTSRQPIGSSSVPKS